MQLHFVICRFRKGKIMSAKKTGGSAGRQRAADSARASFMAAQGVKRTTFRDPITNQIVACGTVPGTKNKQDAWVK
jgi:hypothetical protein